MTLSTKLLLAPCIRPSTLVVVLLAHPVLSVRGAGAKEFASFFKGTAAALSEGARAQVQTVSVREQQVHPDDDIREHGFLVGKPRQKEAVAEGAKTEEEEEEDVSEDLQSFEAGVCECVSECVCECVCACVRVYEREVARARERE
jgi:hypothetical protein